MHGREEHKQVDPELQRKENEITAHPGKFGDDHETTTDVSIMTDNAT